MNIASKNLLVFWLFFVYYQAHTHTHTHTQTKTQASKQTRVRMQAKYTRISSRKDRLSHTETYCWLPVSLCLTVLKSDLAKSAANISMISQYVQATGSSETVVNFKETTHRLTPYKAYTFYTVLWFVYVRTYRVFDGRSFAASRKHIKSSLINYFVILLTFFHTF